MGLGRLRGRRRARRTVVIGPTRDLYDGDPITGDPVEHIERLIIKLSDDRNVNGVEPPAPVDPITDHQ